MKRHALKLLVFLLMGAVTSFGVAWGLAMWAPIPRQPPMAGGVFMHWNKLWATYERKSPGILIRTWAHARWRLCHVAAAGDFGRAPRAAGPHCDDDARTGA